MSIKQAIGKAVINAAVKTFGLSGLANIWDNGGDLDDGPKGSSRSASPYKQVGLVYSCVNALIDGILGLPAVISTIDDRIIESGPVYDLLFANKDLNFEEFVTDSIGHYALTRDVFWIFTDRVGAAPAQVLVVSGSQMHPITSNGRSDGQLAGWEFRGASGQRAEFDLSEVYQWKNFNPYDRFHGLGPLTAGRLNIDYTYASSLFNFSAIENGAELGLILTTEQRLEDDQVRMLRSQMDARHRGAANAKRTAVLTGGLKPEKIAMSMADMEMASISQMSDVRICSVFGVPPECVGIVTEAQYAQGPAQRGFAFNTLIPLARLFAGKVTHGILSKHSLAKHTPVELKDAATLVSRTTPLVKRKSYKDFKTRSAKSNQRLFLWFDYDQHPTVQEAMRESTEKILKFTEAGIPLNDLIDAHDLPYEHVGWGNDWWVTMGLVPARFTLEAGLDGITGPSAPEGGDQPEEQPGDEEGQSLAESVSNIKARLKEYLAAQQKDADEETAKLRIWRAWTASWQPIEREYNEAMRRYFLRQQRILTDALKRAFKESKSTVKNKDDIIARVVFDLKAEDGRLKVRNRVHFDKASELGIRQSVTETAGLSGEELDKVVEQVKHKPAIKAAFVRSSENLKDINRLTQQKIADTLTEGLEKGENLNELTDRIKEQLGSNRARALKIARTQTAGAVSTGRHEGFKSAGVDRKSWITSGDDHVRDAHKAAGVKYTDGIDIDVPFEVGGETLMYPGDPSGSSANIVNCRCMQIALARAGKSFGIEFYANIKFFSYEDMNKNVERKRHDRQNAGE